MSKKLTQKQLTKRWTISAVFIAVSVVLNIFTPIKFPFGGSITVFSMVPLALLGWTYGIGWGFVCGAVMGTLNMLLDGLSNFSYVSGIIAYLVLIFADYFVAFGVLGFSGMFKNKIQDKTVAFGLGTGIACILRLTCHFISGVTIWGDYANGFGGVWLYSLTYNGLYMLPELAITVIGACIIINIKPIMKALED